MVLTGGDGMSVIEVPMRRSTYGIVTAAIVVTVVTSGLAAIAPGAQAAGCSVKIIGVTPGVPDRITVRYTWDPAQAQAAYGSTAWSWFPVQFQVHGPGGYVSNVDPGAGAIEMIEVPGRTGTLEVKWVEYENVGRPPTQTVTVCTAPVSIPALPSLTSVSPSTGLIGGGETVELRGSGLAGATSVNFGGTPAVIVNSADRIVAVKAPVGGQPGSVDVGITVPVAGTSGAVATATLPNAYTYADNPPSIIKVVPACGVGAGMPLSVTGLRLDAATAVTIGGVSAAFTPSSGGLTVTAPAGPTGAAPIVVTSRNGSSTGAFSVSYDPCSPIPTPVIGDITTIDVGGFATVNWSLPGDVSNVAGLQYSLNSGPLIDLGWTPGSARGSFTISGLTQQRNLIKVVALNTNGQPRAAGKGFAFTATPTGLPANTGNAGAVTVPASTAPNPVTPNPVAGKPATPSGGTGATTGGPSSVEGAPCYSTSGSLYPPVFGTVGSTLVMAPNPAKQPSAFTAVGGALPPGMSLDGTFGVLYGVPTQAGRFAVDVTATFTDGTSRTERVALSVDADPQTLQYPTAFGTAIGQGLTALPTSNAPSGSTYRIVCGTLPQGLTFDSSTGAITGTPTVEDTQQLRIVESNRFGTAAASMLLLTYPGASAPPTVRYPAHPHPNARFRTDIQPAVSGADQILYFTVLRGKLPRGLSLDSRTGAVVGSATRRTPRPHTIIVGFVTTSGDLVTTAPMRLTVRPALPRTR